MKKFMFRQKLLLLYLFFLSSFKRRFFILKTKTGKEVFYFVKFFLKNLNNIQKDRVALQPPLQRLMMARMITKKERC